LYHMLSDFHHLRIPLVILLGGTLCIGKSTTATRLADCLNLPSVLNTNVIFELMSFSLKFYL
jgi:2-phosphoglycerate kinase